MFEAYLKSFYIRSSDPTHIKLLKVSDNILLMLVRNATWLFDRGKQLLISIFQLEILTSLATETNISVILRELQVSKLSQL